MFIMDRYAPPDWSLIEWHPDEPDRIYASLGAARRKANWLNANHHSMEAYVFQAVDGAFGARLERRWVGWLPPLIEPSNGAAFGDWPDPLGQ